jgi:hypothetical protein
MLRERLGAALDPVYETYEVPYAVYSVFTGETLIGLVHGVNVPGQGGVIQVFVSVDPETAAVRRLFFQRLESPAARALKNQNFLRQFVGLTLADFYKHDYYGRSKVVAPAGADRVGAIHLPDFGADSAAGLPDYRASLRGLRKNLILLDFFIFGRRFEAFFERANRK